MKDSKLWKLWKKGGMYILQRLTGKHKKRIVFEIYFNGVQWVPDDKVYRLIRKEGNDSVILAMINYDEIPLYVIRGLEDIRHGRW